MALQFEVTYAQSVNMGKENDCTVYFLSLVARMKASSPVR